MDIQISNKKKKKKTSILLFLFLLSLLFVLAYLFLYTFNKPKENIQQENEYSQVVEEEVEENEDQYIIDTGQPYTEELPIIDGQQAYIAVPGKIDTRKPPTVIIYSHGSNTTVTQNMEDQFMQDLKQYGIFFTQHNYIFAASNQHGANWGNSDSIQDTLKLKQWIEEIYYIYGKVYLIGFSMGGLPTMNFTTTYPDLVSKVALLAPTTKSSEWDSARVEKIKDIDMKIWHGNKDVNVPYSNTVSFVNKLKGLGKDIEFVTVEGKGHFDIDTEHMEDILEFFNS